MPLNDEQMDQLRAHVSELRADGLDAGSIRARLHAAGCPREQIDELQAEVPAADPTPGEATQSLQDAVLDLLDLLEPDGLSALAWGTLETKNRLIAATKTHINKIREAL